MADVKKISELNLANDLSDSDEFLVIDKSITSGDDAGVAGRTSKTRLADIKSALGNAMLGPKGQKGESGTPGDIGQRGQPGLDGDDGERGPEGEKGQKGETGSKGIHGDTGKCGAIGLKGNLGSK